MNKPFTKTNHKNKQSAVHRSLFAFAFELVFELKTGFRYSGMLIRLYPMQLYPKCQHPTVSKTVSILDTVALGTIELAFHCIQSWFLTQTQAQTQTQTDVKKITPNKINSKSNSKTIKTFFTELYQMLRKTDRKNWT